MDFGKAEAVTRYGVVGVKAWTHFQRPNLDDELGTAPLEELQDKPEERLGSLLGLDVDYDPEKIKTTTRLNQPRLGRGLWNVENGKDPLIADIYKKLMDIHTPVHIESSRFLPDK